jgi:hypothetical protein
MKLTRQKLHISRYMESMRLQQESAIRSRTIGAPRDCARITGKPEVMPPGWQIAPNALTVIDSESSAERGSGKSLLPGSGLTFGLSLLVRLAGVSRPSFRFVSDTAGVLCVPETICTRALPHTRIHASAGAITGIGTRSISSDISGEIFCGQLLRRFCSLIDYHQPPK